jgi:hypothetical protein
MSIVQAFLDDPGARPQAPCVATETPLDFRHDHDGTSQRLFGRDDLWE